jgi:hypothetical protein
MCGNLPVCSTPLALLLRPICSLLPCLFLFAICFSIFPAKCLTFCQPARGSGEGRRMCRDGRVHGGLMFGSSCMACVTQCVRLSCLAHESLFGAACHLALFGGLFLGMLPACGCLPAPLCQPLQRLLHPGGLVGTTQVPAPMPVKKRCLSRSSGGSTERAGRLACFKVSVSALSVCPHGASGG